MSRIVTVETYGGMWNLYPMWLAELPHSPNLSFSTILIDDIKT